MKTIYLVLPCYNEELVIQDSAIKIENLLRELVDKKMISVESRACFVNDGSQDTTWDLLEKLCEANSYLCAISLAGNRGHQNAMLAGMMTVKDRCDAVITLDADLQHDISIIPEFIKQYEKGYEIVYGVRKSRKGEGIFKRLSGDAFYSLMSVLGTNIIKNHADYRLMSSKAIKALEKYGERNLFLRGIIPSMGFSYTTIAYEEKPRLAGESKYSLKKMIQLAATGITSFSVRPLHFIFFCGIFFFLVSIVMLIYALVVFTHNGSVPGWTSIVAPIWLLGGIQLLALGIVGEYIGKIYMETKHRPRYEIDKVLWK